MKQKIFVISGPSGSGKTTVLKELFELPPIKDNFLRILTVTSRKPRKGEVNGKDYYFVTREKFRALKKEGYFFESKKYADDLYGTPGDFLKKACQNKKTPVLCIDVEGALKVQRTHKDKSVLIFIKPPSEKDLIQRLESRKSEAGESLKKRLRIAKKEVKYAEKYDYSVVNSDLDEAKNSLKEIMLNNNKD